MEPKLQRRVQRYGWDKASAFYEQFWAKQLEPAQTLLLKMASLQKGEHVLDIACGTGLVTFPVAEAVGPRGKVIGTDLSEKMVESLRSEALARKFTNLSAEWMDAEELKFSDDSFDAVLCALGLMYVPDPLKSLREMFRVLKSGGRAVAAVWGARAKCGWAEIFPIVDSRVHSDVCPMFFQLGTGNTLPATFEAAGFGEIQSERIQTILHYDSSKDAIGAAFAGGPVALAYSRFDDQTKQEAHTEYLASIERYRSATGYSIPGEFVVTRGLKV
jgi:ubiquinone/menaquinone biosynthesis C-methylase UbiE